MQIPTTHTSSHQCRVWGGLRSHGSGSGKLAVGAANRDVVIHYKEIMTKRIRKTHHAEYGRELVQPYVTDTLHVC